VDTPPTVPFTDSSLIAAHSDGALLVVRAGRTVKSLVRTALESLRSTVCLGVVLNDIRPTPIERYSYYSYTGYYDGDRKRRARGREGRRP